MAMHEQLVPNGSPPPPIFDWYNANTPAPELPPNVYAWPVAVDRLPVVPALSVIVPTKNEAGNVAELTRRLGAAAGHLPLEVIFVDDSSDETPETIAALDAQPSRAIVLHHRPPEQRSGGLGGAVVEGLRLAKAPLICVMDADLQHPPELVPAMVDQAERTEADVVVASRYCEDGAADGLNHIRASISRGSSFAAHLLFPRRLHGVTDPMSGFFLVRRSAIDPDLLKPNGFKILLEIIGRTPGLRVAEVPFEFGTRHAGESKASLHEGYRYLRTLLSLRFATDAFRFVRFGLIGTSGLFVNMFLVAMLTEAFGIFYLLSAVLATQGSTLWNYALTEHWVFTNENRRYGKAHRAAMYFAMNNAALLLRVPMMFLLTSILGIQYMLSNLISLIALMVLRYATADRFIWRSAPTTVPAGEVVTP
jgi:dolichol-phosphate mannosyltransferase